MRVRLWLLLSLLASGTTWLYMQRVQGPWRYHQNVEVGTLRAEMGDLYSPWVGTRDLLLYGRNPYGPEVSHEIQMAFYGHVITQNDETRDKSGKLVDEQRFAYPVYVVFLMAPAIYSSFANVQVWAPVLLAGLTAGSVLLWLNVLRWRPPAAAVAAVILFVLSSPQIVQGLRLRQLGLLVGFMLALATWCVTRNRLTAAGIILALSTIKPQMTVIPLAWFALWSLGDWPRRWRLLASFAGTLIALVVAGELILPGWPRYFLEGLAVYRRYTYRESLLELVLGAGLGTVCGAIIIVGLLALAWRNRKQAAGSQEFTLTLAWLFTGAALSLPLLPIFNQIILILPTLMLLRGWTALRNLARFTFIVSVGWPWLASLVLLLLLPRQPDSHSQLWLLPSSVALVVPFVLALLLMPRDKESLATLFARPLR